MPYAAIALAARIPAVRLGGAVEIRPAEKYWCSHAPVRQPAGKLDIPNSGKDVTEWGSTLDLQLTLDSAGDPSRTADLRIDRWINPCPSVSFRGRQCH